MKQIKWFERKFDFSYDQNIFPSIIERLKGTPIRLRHALLAVPEEILQLKPDGKWSILENIGHLLDLEPMWQGRMGDILEGEKWMRKADLKNTKTHRANHNERNAADLIREFEKIRSGIVVSLEGISSEQVFQSSLHPRLEKPMRMMDLFLFVAEHDDHHLARIAEIIRSTTSTG